MGMKPVTVEILPNRCVVSLPARIALSQLMSRLHPCRLRVWLAAALLLSGLTLIWPWPAAAPVEAVTVRQDHPRRLTQLQASGQLGKLRTQQLHAPPGQLQWLGVPAGARVQAGEVLARLQSARLDQARQQTQDALALARAELEQATQQLHQTRARLRQPATAALNQADGQLKQAQASERAGQAAIRQAETALRQATQALDATLVRAPFAGWVQQRHGRVGEETSPATHAAPQALFTLVDAASLQVKVSLSASEQASIRLGQACVVQLAALPGQSFAGEVSHITPPHAVIIQLQQYHPQMTSGLPGQVTFLSHPRPSP